MSMHIALFGKPFYEKHKESVKHVVERVAEIDPSALLFDPWCYVGWKGRSMPA